MSQSKNGKGSKRRPALVPEQEVTDSWALCFGSSIGTVVRDKPTPVKETDTQTQGTP